MRVNKRTYISWILIKKERTFVLELPPSKATPLRCLLPQRLSLLILCLVCYISCKKLELSIQLILLSYKQTITSLPTILSLERNLTSLPSKRIRQNTVLAPVLAALD